MSTWLERVPLPVQGAALHAVFALPKPLRRLIAGAPVRRDGLELALDAQLLLKMMALSNTSLTKGTAADARAQMELSRRIIATPDFGVRSRDLDIPADGGTIPARLYEPAGVDAGSPLLVFYHGGGWVIGSIETHDANARYLARQAGLRVLSVGYRLAPEDPFPAAPDDAFAAFQFAVANAEALGALLRLVTRCIPLGPRMEFLVRQPSLDLDEELMARVNAIEEPINDLIQRGQQAGAFRADAPIWWMNLTFTGLIYSAWEAIQQGRLAPLDAPEMVVRTFMDGFST